MTLDVYQCNRCGNHPGVSFEIVMLTHWSYSWRALFRLAALFISLLATDAFQTRSVPTSHLDGHGTSHGFHPAVMHASNQLGFVLGLRQPSTRLLFSASPQDSGERGLVSENDVRLLLTQCSIQSFMFLLTQMRDPHLIKWLDSFTKPTTGPFGEGEKGYGEANGLIMEGQEESNESSAVENDKRLSSRLLYYHGIAGLNSTIFPTWDAYFRSLLEEPGTQFVVESNNRVVREFTVDIEPASICSRILSVREQIAKEWVRDLDVVISRGDHILYSVHQKMRRERGELDTEAGSSEGIDDKYKLGEALGNNWVRVPPMSSSGDGDAAFERMNLSFLENENSENAPSPLRKGNFDLLTLLATKESIRRVLSGGISAEYDTGEENDGIRTTLTSASVDFLRSFYEDRAEYHFGSKSKRYHMADEFIEQLVMAPARMVTLPKPVGGDAPIFIDPVVIAEVILKERGRVAKEWKEVAGASPLEHSEIRGLQLNRMMGL